MLDSREFDAMPILADALEDAGCVDEELLTLCKKPDLKPVQAERVVNLVYSEETAAAVRWLEQFVRDINYRDYKDEDDEVGTESDTDPHSYEEIIETGRQGLDEGAMHFGSDDGADFFRRSAENRREFFRNWSLVTGEEAPARRPRRRLRTLSNSAVPARSGRRRVTPPRRPPP
jgi:hypothetical protein